MRLFFLLTYSCSLALQEKDNLETSSSEDDSLNKQLAIALISTPHGSYNKESKQIVSVKNCSTLTEADLDCHNCKILSIAEHGLDEHYVTILAHKSGYEVELTLKEDNSCGEVEHSYGKYFFKESANQITSFETTLEDGVFDTKIIAGSTYSNINNIVFFKHDLYFKYTPHEYTYLKIDYGFCDPDLHLDQNQEYYSIVIDLHEQIKDYSTLETYVVKEENALSNFRFIDHALTFNPSSSIYWLWKEKEKKLSFYLDKKKVAFLNGNIYADAYNLVTPDIGLNTAAKNYCLKASYYEEGDEVLDINNINLINSKETYQKKVPVIVGTALFNTSESSECPEYVDTTHETFYSLGAVHEVAFQYPNSSCLSTKITKKPSFFETKYLDFAAIEPLNDQLNEVAPFNNFSEWLNNYYGSYLSIMPLKDDNFTCPSLYGAYQNNNNLNQFQVRGLWQGLNQNLQLQDIICQNQSKVISAVDLFDVLKTDGTWFKNQLPFTQNFLPEITMIHNRLKEVQPEEYFSLEASFNFYSASETLDIRARLKGYVVEVNDLENPAELGPGTHNNSGDRDLFRESPRKFMGTYTYKDETAALWGNLENLFDTDVKREKLNDKAHIKTHIHELGNFTNYPGDDFYPIEVDFVEQDPVEDSYWVFVVNLVKNFKNSLLKFVSGNTFLQYYLGNLFYIKSVEVFLSDKTENYKLTQEYEQQRISKTLIDLKKTSYPLTIGIYHSLDLFPTAKNFDFNKPYPYILKEQKETPFYQQYLKLPLVNYSYLTIDYGY